MRIIIPTWKSAVVLGLLIVVFVPVTGFAAVDTITNKKAEELLNLKDFAGPKRGKWLPIPMPVSNPSVGNGLAVALLYIGSKDEDIANQKPSTTGIAGMYTDTESWIAGAFHDNNWFHDRLRLKAFVGVGELNLEYYGIGSGSIFKAHPVDYSIGAVGYQWQLSVQPLKNSKWYLGLRQLFSSTEITFKLSDLISFLPDVGGTLYTSGLGPVATYDSRDNSYYPTKGTYFETVLSFDDPAWGSDFTFTKSTSFYNHYFSVTDNAVIALKVDLGLADSETPFFMLPSLKMRAFAMGKYSNETALSAHIEWRHKFLPRWGYNLAYEGGYVYDSLDGLFDTEYIYSIGAGVRWQVLKDEKMHIGVDFGFNDEDSSIIVQVGERF